MPAAPKYRTVHVTDERSDLALHALEIIRASVREVQPTAHLLAELEESRRELRTASSYHMLVTLTADDTPVAAAAGAYLAGANTGYVAYLAVSEAERSARLGTSLRAELVKTLRDDAQRIRGQDLNWVVGEVRRKNRWLQRLVQKGAAIPFDFSYFHPWQPFEREHAYVLYREPIADARTVLPSVEVKQLVYALWRVAYRIPYPTQSPTFQYMLEQLDAREEVGVGDV